MIDTPTLFILGAGASKPYGYPTGAELRADVVANFPASARSEMSGNRSTIQQNHMLRQIEHFANNFFGSSLKSIDKYLALNTNDAYIGKIAITLSILRAEIGSRFRENVIDANEDWYGYLFNRMTSTFNKPEDYEHFFDNKVAFITFNYDRSLEYYLYDSFCHSFSQKRKDIRNNMLSLSHFPIMHVYGSVGEMSLFGCIDDNQDYGKIDLNFKSIESLSNGIKVIGEERSGESVKGQIKELLQNYKRIFFLGFGYAQENLDAIDLLNNIDHTWTIYGTAKGMTPKEIKDIRNRFPSFKTPAVINPMFDYPIHSVPGSIKKMDTVCATIEDKNCYALLREYL